MEKAVVIGGGLAGTAVAEALQRRGFAVSLLERHGALAKEASGQAAAIAQPILHRQPSAKMRLSLSGFFYFLSHLERLLCASCPIRNKACGVLQLAHKEGLAERFRIASNLPFFLEQRRLQIQLLDTKQASELCGMQTTCGGVFFPQALWLSPKDLCQAHLSVGEKMRSSGIKKIDLRYFYEALRLEYNAQQRLWHIYDTRKRKLEARYLVLACGAGGLAYIEGIAPPWELCLKKVLRQVRGQSFLMPAKGLSQALLCPLSYDGFCIPQVDAQANCLVGASFEEWNTKAEMEPKQNEMLYHRLLALLPNAGGLTGHAEGGSSLSSWLAKLNTRVAFRCSSPDRMPLCGPLHSQEQGLYLSTAYSSHALLFSILGAEYIARHICQEKTSTLIEDDLIDAISPQRYSRFFCKD